MGENSHLIDAATWQTLPGKEVPDLIAGFAAGFLSAGLGAGDRALIGCDLSPASTLAYLGAMYAGLVPVLVDERALATTGESIAARARVKAVWVAKGVH